MTQKISGQVTEGGSAVENAVVIATLQENVANLSQSQATAVQSFAKLTDANGNYTFEPEELFTGTENYHVVAHKDAGNQRRGQQNYPYVKGEGAQPDSAVSRWTFDNENTQSGTAIDVWGKNNATINGATTGVSGANQTYTTSEAYDFDGSNDYVDVPVFSQFSSVSVAVWAYHVTNNGKEGVLGFNQNNHIDIRGYDTDNDSAVLILSGTELAGPKLSTNTWHHLTATWDGSTARLYVDGTQEASENIGSMNQKGEGCQIGRRSNVGGFKFHFDGRIDDVRVYNKGLTSNEVSNLYNNGAI
jgi:hypothetical protein